MKYDLFPRHVLHELGIGKSYNGYDYILYGLSLVEEDEFRLTNITKILYIDIAQYFQTSPVCVERNIRKVIEVIWKHATEHKHLIIKIFGSRYEMTKPTNKEFLELLYEYMTFHDIFEELIIQCPFSQKNCDVYRSIIENLSRLK